VATAGLRNVTFTQSDVGEIPRTDLFDAAVGRFILMYISDPIPIVHSLSRLVRPGGVIAFHEVSWGPFLKRCEPLPLCAACATLIHETFQRRGVNPEAGPNLFQVFPGAGLLAPIVKTATVLEDHRDLSEWLAGILQTMEPQIQQLGLSRAKLGDIETLPDRLLAELAKSDAVLGGPDQIVAWSRIPR
jgi:hypothetical protein